MFSAAHMSKAEFEFIRLYVQIAYKRFDALQIVLALMHPDNLAVADIVTAADLTNGLDRLQADFDRQIQQLQLKHNIASKKFLPGVPDKEQLANIIIMSFFKVVGVMNAEKGLLAKTDQKGWFSGKPKDWATLFDKLVADISALNDTAALPGYLKSIAKFFPKYYQPGKWSKLYPPPNYDHDYDEYADDDYEDDE